MSGFHDRYSPNIQWGQGAADLVQQYIQMMMMKKMFADQSEPPQTPMGMGQGMPDTGLMPLSQGQSNLGQSLAQNQPNQMTPQRLAPQAPSQLQQGRGVPQMTPELMRMIMQLVQGGMIGR